MTVEQLLEKLSQIPPTNAINKARRRAIESQILALLQAE